MALNSPVFPVVDSLLPASKDYDHDEFLVTCPLLLYPYALFRVIYLNSNINKTKQNKNINKYHSFQQ